MSTNAELVVSTKIESVLMGGDLAPLSSEERVSYYNSVCSSLGLNSLTKPFEFIKLNGKLQLYARKDATDQLRRVHNISIKITGKEAVNDIYMVTAEATNKNGRKDEASGMVNIANLKGEALANALMKAETKAKRRVTLSICGLGLLDETEVDDIPKEVKDVTPEVPFLTQPEESHGALIKAFMGIGVSEDEVLHAVRVASVGELSDENISELRDVYSEIKTNGVDKDFYFK